MSYLTIFFDQMSYWAKCRVDQKSYATNCRIGEMVFDELSCTHCAVIRTEQKLTWPYLDFSNGDEIRKGSARPGSYKLVRPVGNGIPLSEV